MCLRSVYVHLFMFFLIYFWPRWTFISLEGFPCLWAEGYCPLAVRGFLVAGASLIAECGLSSCGTTGLVALRHVGSSQARDRTHVPCIGRQILYHCATREVPDLCYSAHDSSASLTSHSRWQYLWVCCRSVSQS